MPLYPFFKRFSVISALFLLFLAGSSDLYAANQIDDFTGIDQSFTADYGYRQFSEQSQSAGTYDLLVPEETKMKEKKLKEQEEKQYIDQWRYEREISHSTTFDSNVKLTRLDPKDDLVHYEKLNLGMTRNGKYSFVDMFYNASYTHYVSNHKQNAVTHTQTTVFGYKMGRLTLTVLNSFSPSKAFAPGERTELVSAGNKRVIAITDGASIDADYKVSQKTNAGLKFGWDIFYLPTASNSSAVNSFSTMTYSLTPSVSYQWSPKLRFHAEYLLQEIDYIYGGPLDGWNQVPTAGFSVVLSPKTDLSLDLGYKDRSYAQDTIKDVEGVRWRFALNRKLTPKIVATLSTSRDVLEDLDSSGLASTPQLYQFYGADFTWKTTPHISLDWGASIGRLSEDKYVTLADADNPTLFFTRKPISDLYKWYINLSWTPRRYLTTFLGYEFSNNNASFKDNDYLDHKVVGSLSAKF